MVGMEGLLGNIFREGSIESSRFCWGRKDTQDTHMDILPSNHGPVYCLRTLPLESSSSQNNCGAYLKNSWKRQPIIISLSRVSMHLTQTWLGELRGWWLGLQTSAHRLFWGDFVRSTIMNWNNRKRLKYVSWKVWVGRLLFYDLPFSLCKFSITECTLQNIQTQNQVVDVLSYSSVYWAPRCGHCAKNLRRS